ncbi:MAG: bifunctional demethylmenaquinone methyltransferase/2-methoxy-6-polyprenyl-1,4-benzoquinol methylase UbiE [Desulfobacterales bacterium]|nr:bifunctional demethylmenaquinone methyltransferase/2-methoxy-6-polyprenyl-1,4-benzoquinol methylase UbiE [Desulfobacterales bacterium]MBS3756844.1 bifunctional demethylmenaquinone methyltransferase/2-methoxy-6-polyprenyl-1,4-benzoquinol methylase UbiE [Desulfobacterales bacterium]
MGLRKNPGWFGRQQREKVLDPDADDSGYTYFGLRHLPAEKKKDAVRRHFNRVAPRYDFMNTVLSFGIHYAWKRAAVAMMGLKPGDRVLDVCGGTGDLAVYAAGRIGGQGRVFVYDMNAEMMRAGMVRPENRRLRGRIHYVRGDAECMALPDNCFDAAMVGFGIRNLTHVKQGFAEMYRVLKPGGHIMCLEFSRPVNPVFREVYDLYSFYVMPLIGRLLAGSRRSYACLSETIRMFATAEELKAILGQTGFESVSYRRQTNGIAAIHTGSKPERIY